MPQIKPDKEVKHCAQKGNGRNDKGPGKLDGRIIPGVDQMNQHDCGEGFHRAEEDGKILGQTEEKIKNNTEIDSQKRKNQHGAAEDDPQQAALAFFCK